MDDSSEDDSSEGGEAKAADAKGNGKPAAPAVEKPKKVVPAIPESVLVEQVQKIIAKIQRGT